MTWSPFCPSERDPFLGLARRPNSRPAVPVARSKRIATFMSLRHDEGFDENRLHRHAANADTNTRHGENPTRDEVGLTAARGQTDFSRSGRVDLGGRPPRPPTDPGLHITRTRFLIS